MRNREPQTLSHFARFHLTYSTVQVPAFTDHSVFDRRLLRHSYYLEFMHCRYLTRNVSFQTHTAPGHVIVHVERPAAYVYAVRIPAGIIFTEAENMYWDAEKSFFKIR